MDFLPGQNLPDNLQAASAPSILADSDCVLMVAPAQFARSVIADLAAILPAHAMLVLCAKGVERGSLKFMSQLASEYLPENRLAVLSGPSFAHILHTLHVSPISGIKLRIASGTPTRSRKRRITGADACHQRTCNFLRVSR